MAVTVLSGTSGALYYKPAGTVGTFGTSNVTIATETIVVQSYLNLKVGDPVQFKVINSQTGGSGTGTLPAGLSAGTTIMLLLTQPVMEHYKFQLLLADLLST